MLYIMRPLTAKENDHCPTRYDARSNDKTECHASENGEDIGSARRETAQKMYARYKISRAVYRECGEKRRIIMITHFGFTCKSVDTNWRQTFLSRVLFEYSTPSNMSHFYDSCIRLMSRKKKNRTSNF